MKLDFEFSIFCSLKFFDYDLFFLLVQTLFICEKKQRRSAERFNNRYIYISQHM